MSDTDKTASKPAAADKPAAKKDPFDLPGTRCFGIDTTWPVEFQDPRCCAQFGARVWLGENDQPWIEYRHEEDCDVWQYLP